MLTLSIIGIIWFILGLIYLLYNFNIQPSLSQNYYCLKERNKGHWFYLYLIITVFLLIYPLCNIAGGFGFMTCAGLAFVGAAAAFEDDKTQFKVHVTGAAVSATGAILTLFTMGLLKVVLITLPIALILSLITKTFRTSYVFWLEMVAFFSLFTGLILFLI